MSEADSLSMSMENVRVDVFGDSAFAFSNRKIHATFGGDTHEFPLRATFGLVRTDGGWRIAQSHFSAIGLRFHWLRLRRRVLRPATRARFRLWGP
jgi:ketosteroid isomerase-like protein